MTDNTTVQPVFIGFSHANVIPNLKCIICSLPAKKVFEVAENRNAEDGIVLRICEICIMRGKGNEAIAKQAQQSLEEATRLTKNAVLLLSLKERPVATALETIQALKEEGFVCPEIGPITFLELLEQHCNATKKADRDEDNE